MFNHEERIAVPERIVKDLDRMYFFVCPTGSLQHFDALTRHDSA